MNNSLDYFINNKIFINSSTFINWKDVIELIDDDLDFYKSLFEQFLTEIDNDLKIISLNKDDFFLIKNTIHKLKGASLSLGLYNISSILNFYSNKLKKKDITTIDQNFFDDINKSIKNTTIEFNNYYENKNFKL